MVTWWPCYECRKTKLLATAMYLISSLCAYFLHGNVSPEFEAYEHSPFEFAKTNVLHVLFLGGNWCQRTAR